MNKQKTSKLRIIPLGGQGEVGRNMIVLEYEGKIIITDMGLGFPEEGMLGIDCTIPNSKYLKNRKKDILGIFITHGHYDHIGAIPYTLPRLGSIPIYTGSLTKGMILKRQEEFPNQPDLEIHQINPKEKVELGPFNIEAFHINHTIPDNLGFFIKTPAGNVVNTSDFKFDENPLNDKPIDYQRLKEIGNKGVDLLMCESTGAENEDHSLSEKTIFQNLEKLFQRAEGARIIAGSFASNINRIQQFITLSEKYGRKVVIEGRSMRTNIEVGRNLNKIKVKKGSIIKTENAHRYPDTKLTLICTGAQGEDRRAAFMRIANQEHKYFQVKKGDMVVFSSSIVPGNERDVQFLKDEFYRQGAKVFDYNMMDIHASGHGGKPEYQRMMEIMSPKFLLPIYGHYSMLINNKYTGQKAGIPEKNIGVPSNGQVVTLSEDKMKVTKERVSSNLVMVDGLGIGDVGEVVLRDRQNLSQEGMFMVVVAIDSQKGEIRGSPDIISRGFVYLRESQDLLQDTRDKIKEVVNKAAGHDGIVNIEHVKDDLRNKIGSLLFQKTQRRPMILPVVIEV